MKRLAVNLLKLAVSLGILAYLLQLAWRDGTIDALSSQPKHWGYLFAAWVLCQTAVLLTITRWYLLVRALAIRFRYRDALRLGFLGYMLNFVSLGSVGGDLFKAVFIAREQPGRRTEAVASVLVDRVVGLYGLFVVATLAILVTGQYRSEYFEVLVICRGAIAATIAITICVGIMLLPGFTNGPVSEFLMALPRTGHIFRKLIGAIRMYRRRLGTLALAWGISLGVHTLNSLGIYMIARALPGDVPPLLDMVVIVTMGMVAGALPLPLAGLGAFEGVIDFLYRVVPVGLPIRAGQGLLVALGYRAVTILIAMVGAVVYLAARREMADVLHEAEESQESGDGGVAGAKRSVPQ